MVLDAARTPLRLASLVVPMPAPHQVLIRVHACAVCRTDLHVVDGELAEPKLPLMPGHEIIGSVAALGEDVDRFAVGDRVGVPWLGWTCGECEFCRSGRENLCAQARFTGYQIDGGYSEFTIADQRFCFAIPAGYSDIEAAPLLCAGLIGYRSLRMAGDARRSAFTASALRLTSSHRSRGGRAERCMRLPARETRRRSHLRAIWVRMGRWLRSVTAGDARCGDHLRARWIVGAGGAARGRARRHGCLRGIHMSAIPSFPYDILWGERVVRSVANLTRRDGEEFLELAPKVPVKTRTLPYPLEQAIRHSMTCVPADCRERRCLHWLMDIEERPGAQR